MGRLPPNPQVACKLLHLMTSDVLDNRDIVQTIQYEPVLTARLLKVCASVVWTRDLKPSSLEEAVFHLGHQEITRLVLALSIGGTLSQEHKGYRIALQQLWRHAAITAIASERLASFCKTPVENLPFVFTVGLLHDIGKSVLDQVLHPEIQDEIRLCIQQYGQSMAEAETTVLGTNHAEIGARLLERWKLPDPLVEGVAYHHRPSVIKPKLSTLINLANHSAHSQGSPYLWDPKTVRLSTGALDALGMTLEDLERNVAYMHDEAVRVEAFMAIY